MDTFHEFRAYWQLSEDLIADATKEDLAETARILALQAAHYARKFGELPIPDMAHFLASTDDVESVALLRDGTIALVGILAHRNAVAHGDLRRSRSHDTNSQTQAQHQFAQFHSIAPRGSVDDNKLRINLSYKFHYGVTFDNAA